MTHTSPTSHCLTFDASILSTDFVPDSTQTRNLRIQTTRQKSEIKALNSQVATLQRHAYELCVRVSEIEGTVKLHEALLSPNRWLAPETLGEVFIHCLEDDEAITASIERAPLLLIQVCRRWRRVTFGTPRLWERLCLGRGFSLDPFTIIPLWLRNSGSRSLDFRMSLQDWRIDYTRRTFERDLARLLAQSVHRCRSLAGSISTLAIGEIFGHDAILPHLKNLDLWLPDQDQLSSPGSVPNIGTLATPCLESITLNDTGFVTRAIPGPLPLVQQLQLTGQESFGLLSHSSCLDFIALCPNLQSCILTLSKDPGRPFLSPVILDSLRHLHLIFQFSPHDPIPFLKALKTPHIERLTLQNHGGVSPVPHIRRVLKLLLSVTPHTIKELELFSLFVPTSDWVPSLRELTELTALSIVGDSLDQNFFEALTSDDPSSPWPCPKLTSLKLHHVSGLIGVSGERLVAFVRSRAPPESSGLGEIEDGSTYLQSLSLVLCDLEHHHEVELREIAKQSNEALRLYGLEPYDAKTVQFIVQAWRAQEE